MTPEATQLPLQSKKCSTDVPAQQKLVQGCYVTSHHTLLWQLLTDTDRKTMTSIPPAYAFIVCMSVFIKKLYCPTFVLFKSLMSDTINSLIMRPQQKAALNFNKIQHKIIKVAPDNSVT